MFATKHQRRARLARLHRQRGASLLEAIAYLGVAALVVLAAVSLLQNAFGSARSNQTTEEITGLRTNVRKMYAGQSYTDPEMLKNMITAKAIPGTLSVSTDGLSINNTWGGTVTPSSANHHLHQDAAGCVHDRGQRRDRLDEDCRWCRWQFDHCVSRRCSQSREAVRRGGEYGRVHGELSLSKCGPS